MTTTRHTLLLFCSLCIVPGLIAGDLDISLGNALQSSIAATWHTVSNVTAALARATGNAWKNYGTTALTRLAYALVVAAIAGPIINRLICYRKQQLRAQSPEHITLIAQAAQAAKRRAHEDLDTYIDRLQELRNNYAQRYNQTGLKLLQAKFDLNQLMDQDHPAVMAEKQAIRQTIISHQALQRDLKAAIDLVDAIIKKVS